MESRSLHHLLLPQSKKQQRSSSTAVKLDSLAPDSKFRTSRSGGPLHLTQPRLTDSSMSSAPMSPPGSPTKSRSSQFLRNLLTGVAPADPEEHARRWQRTSPTKTTSQETGMPPPPVPRPRLAVVNGTNGSGRVASMVKGYEAASLSASRPYSALPSPTLPPASTSPSPSPSPTTVPASFFQNQQARRTPDLSRSPVAHREESKENYQSPRPFSPSKSARAYSTPLPPPSPSRTPSSTSYRSDGESTTCASEDVKSVVSSRPNSCFSAEAAPIQFARIEQTVQRSPEMARRPPPPSADSPFLPPKTRKIEEDAKPPLRPKSSFIENIPLSFPLERSSIDYAPLPLEQSPRLGSPESERPSVRRRAMTFSGDGASRDQLVETALEKTERIEREFAKLLDDMQLPSPSVRRKMLALPLPMKEQMLSGSTTRSQRGHSRGHSSSILSASVGRSTFGEKKNEKSTKSKGFLRKSKSSVSLKLMDEAASNSPYPTYATKGGEKRKHERTASSSSLSLFRSLGRSTGPSPNAAVGRSDDEAEDAVWWAVKLRSASYKVLDPKEVGRLRGRLRGEAPSWVEDFLRHGGYTGLLERLKDILDLEWREEQHDDQLLYELLRCFKALMSTACGKREVGSRSPTPFVQLAALLFSEKKPGDIPGRQLLVESIHSLFALAPEAAGPVSKSDWSMSIELGSGSPVLDGGSAPQKRYTRAIKGEDGREEQVSEERAEKTHAMVWSLMAGPPNEKEESKVDFIQDAHRKREFKLWVTELSDCVRDYFWVFCRAQNKFWSYEAINPDEIEAPKVPSGMTGGVEFEAMAYCTAHFRLINAIAKGCPNAKVAFEFHSQLFDSGIERVLMSLRRASQAYYSTLHLELSRYVALARSVRFNLGAAIISYLEPSTLCEAELRVLEQYEARRRAKVGGGTPQIQEMKF